MTDAHARISLYRVGPGLRRGLVVAGLALAIVVAGLPAGAHAPESGTDPSVTLNVAPDDTATDGQSVTVVGAGFPANAAGLLRQCAGSIASPVCDGITSGIFQTYADGTFPPSALTVLRVIHTNAVTHDCSVEACFIYATAGGKSSQHHIRVVAPGQVVTTVPPTTIGGPTTMPPPTTVQPPHTVEPRPTTIVPNPPPAENFLCAIIRGLGNALPGLLAGISNALLNVLGCAPL